MYRPPLVTRTSLKGPASGMNWFFLRPPAPAENCDRVQPLLSLLADGMASRTEARRARLHLETCADCRQAFVWMQATHDVLATREALPVPADVRARCRRAWAAEDALVRPARRPAPSRALRPVFAAALSLVAVGVVAGHYLAPAPVQTVKPHVVAVVPRTTVMPPAVTHHAPPQTIAAKPRREREAAPAPVRPTETLRPDTIAFVPPAPVKHALPRVKVDVPALVAKQPAPIVRKPAPAPLVVAVKPHPRPELTPAAPHDTPPAQIANKTPDAVTPAPLVQVAVLPKQDVPAPRTAEYVAPRPADPMGVVRVHLASLNSEGGRKIAMTGGVHFQPAFVQSAIVYTPR